MSKYNANIIKLHLKSKELKAKNQKETAEATRTACAMLAGTFLTGALAYACVDGHAALTATMAGLGGVSSAITIASHIIAKKLHKQEKDFSFLGKHTDKVLSDYDIVEKAKKELLDGGSTDKFAERMEPVATKYYDDIAIKHMAQDLGLENN